MTYNVRTLLQNSQYKLSRFTETQIGVLERRIFDKEIRGKKVPYTICIIRNKAVQAKPEEIVRQL